MLTSCTETTSADISKGFRKELVVKGFLLLDIKEGLFPVAGCKSARYCENIQHIIRSALDYQWLSY